MTTEEIAEVCHAVNAAYCRSIYDQTQVDWDRAEEWQRISAINGVKFHMYGSYGPDASHKSWMKEKIEDGWQYGKVKDVDKKLHPCLVPFDDLPQNQQSKDYIFAAIVHALAQYTEPPSHQE